MKDFEHESDSNEIELCLCVHVLITKLLSCDLYVPFSSIKMLNKINRHLVLVGVEKVPRFYFYKQAQCQTMFLERWCVAFSSNIPLQKVVVVNNQ